MDIEKRMRIEGVAETATNRERAGVLFVEAVLAIEADDDAGKLPIAASTDQESLGGVVAISKEARAADLAIAAREERLFIALCVDDLRRFGRATLISGVRS